MDKEKETLEDISSVLRERDRIDRMIREKFEKEMTIMFSDVCGSTQYMDTHGDIKGRAWIQHHDEIVMPIIEKHGGEILNTMGDGILSGFASSIDAVKAASEMQSRFVAYNAGTPEADRIHIKVGINSGGILADSKIISGDVVNVASRIESQARPDEILVSKSVYDAVCESEDVLCRYHEKVKVKGKAKEIELFRVIWKDEDVVMADSAVRAADSIPMRKSASDQGVLQLDIIRENDRLKIGAHERVAGEENTVRFYEETRYSADAINARCAEIVNILNSVNRKGRVTRDVLTRLREIGQVLYDELFPLGVKEKIRLTTSQHILLSMDDELVHIPWELLHDGKRFLSLGFSMGRVVRTRAGGFGETKNRVLAKPLRMLIIADPRGDLKGAYEEGTHLRDRIDVEKHLVNVSLHSEDVTRDFLREKIRNFDMVHYAGHTDYFPDEPQKSGWSLKDKNEPFRAEHIMKMFGTAAMPALVFSNACQSAREEDVSIHHAAQRGIYSLANAFLLSGVRHYVGTFWEILDEPSRRFSLSFYNALFSGACIGEAVRQARHTLIEEYGEETIVWGSYLLYGDPTFNYLDQIERAGVRDEEPLPSVSVMGDKTRTEDVIDFLTPAPAAKKSRRAIWAVGIVLAVLFGILGHRFLSARTIAAYEDRALSAYKAGDAENTLALCSQLSEKDPENGMANLLKGKIRLEKGDLDIAAPAFNSVIASGDASSSQKADAFMGLGRIASLKKDTAAAIGYYRKAVALAPGNQSALVALGVLLEKNGETSQAVYAFQKARQIDPNDFTLAAMEKDAAQKAAYAADKEKQARVDALVADLLKSMDQGQAAPAAADTWTSKPLTLWIMDLETSGFSLDEGIDKRLEAGLTESLLQSGRIRVVERALLDKLLSELKLGASALSDRRTALSLGKILAARLVLTGRIDFSGKAPHVSLWLINTETSGIMATLSADLDQNRPIDESVKQLSGELLSKILAASPLRAVVSKIENNVAYLNIGTQEGVRAGDQFKTTAGDAVLQVTACENHSASARIEKGDTDVAVGMWVEEM